MAVKITDLVDPGEIQKLKDLDTELQTVFNTYVAVAKDMAKGLTITVNGIDDLEKAEKMLAEKGKEAIEVQQKLADVAQRRSQAMANTTNTISRELMEQERVNKTTREAYTEQEKVKRLLDSYHDTYENQVRSLISINKQLEANKKQQKDNEKALSEGRMTAAAFNKAQVELMASTRDLTQQKRTLNQIMTAEEKANLATEGSYVQLSQQLELLKKAYKEMGEEARSSDFGREVEASIQNLDAHLKDMAADMGEFQRNVGNYAIAGQNGVVSTESLTAAMSQEARTMQDVADQTRILEEAKMMLDKNDANYQQTLSDLNAKIDENKRKLTDVSDIMHKDATSVAEAEAQNKRLMEALKHVDVTSDGAEKRIKELNEKIAKNTELIKKNTPAVQDNAKANQDLSSRLLGLCGINTQFGSSLKGLESAKTSNVLDGINTSTKAFGKTLMGLLSNPWVLAFLGIAGVVAGFKWWYDYNKGLIEASRLTENFTGATGEAADKVTSDMSALADHMGKGYAETIGAANTLVQQFGLSWEEANTLMRDGIQAGADMSGNMLSNIDRFAPALRDAGVSASEFMSILAETRNGVFSEQGIQDILKGGTRLRAMTKQISESLDAVGISSVKMQKDLNDGNITMLEAVQQVATKLKELPENSQEAGNLMKNVFGRTAAEGGTLLIQSIADINTSLDEAKDRTGEWGEATRAQLDAEQELSETVNAVFKMSGTNFESMIAYAKAYVAQGLTAIIKGCINIANWFIRMYNNSLAFRGAVNSIVNSFKVVYEIFKFVFKQIIDGVSAAGTAIEGMVTLDWDKVKKGWSDGTKALRGNVEAMARNIGANFANAYNKTVADHIDELPLSLAADDTTNTAGGGGNGKGKGKGGGGNGNGDNKDAEKHAKETLKILQDLEESKIALMADGHEKEMATIRLNYKKKIEAIKGNSAEEEQLRLNIIAQMEKALSDCELKYQQNLAAVNLANRLALVKKGSKEELDLKLGQIEQSRIKELAEAQRTGADINLINEKFNAQRVQLQEEYAKKQTDILAQEYADRAEQADTAMVLELNAIKERYAEELAAAKGNAGKQAEIKERFEQESAAIQERYAMQTAQNAISLIEEQLKTENLSAEEREDLERKLAKAKADLEKQMADAAVENINRINTADANSTEKRISNAQQWLQAAADSLNAINELVAAVYDAKITKMDEEQEANSEANEAEQERIQQLVEKKVITEEEGEARKRAAEERTAKKNEELEKKKGKLKERQAKFDKLNSIAQLAIATAVSMMQLWTNPGYPAAIPMMAVVGALSAIQLATILATPLPKYAKGTDRHKGGPAIVGDAGVPEVITYGGNAWITPDKPTIVDIPAGATVIPDVATFSKSDFAEPVIIADAPKAAPKAYNDAKVIDRLDDLIAIKRRESKKKREEEVERQLALYKIEKGL